MRLNYEKEETIRTVTLICFIIGFLLACTAIGFLLYAGRMRARRQKIMKETEQMSSLYPSYLRKNSADFSFPENAIKILRYQAEGMTNEEIARLLGVNVGTVKYHCKENYKKLGVKGKAAAISEARKRKLI